MNAKQFLAYFRELGPQDENVLFQSLADHMYELKLRTGHRLWQVADVRAFLEELAAEARIPQSTEVADVADLRTRPRVTSSQFVGEFCPDCGHIHIDDRECGFPTGGGRVCRCERAVPA